MSRIGKRAIAIPKGVEVAISDDAVVVKGPKGSLAIGREPGIDVEKQDGKLVISAGPGASQLRANHGLMRALCNNMILGVSRGWERKLEINGVGYRAEVSGKTLNLQLGYSHPIQYKLPEGVSAKVEKNLVVLAGIDKQVVGAAAAEIRRLRPPEPYKGKGVKYLEEQIQRKVGKAAG